MCKEFELHPHTDPVVLHVMISCAGKRIVIQLKIQVWHQFIQLIYKNNSQKKKTIKDYTVFGLEKKLKDGMEIRSKRSKRIYLKLKLLEFPRKN